MWLLVKAVFDLLCLTVSVYRYPDLAYNVEKILASARGSIHQSSLTENMTLFTVTVFNL